MEVDIVPLIHVEKEEMDVAGKCLVPMSYVAVARKSGRIVHSMIVQVPLEAIRITLKRKHHRQRIMICRTVMTTRVMMILWMIGMEICQTEVMQKIIGRIGRIDGALAPSIALPT